MENNAAAKQITTASERAIAGTFRNRTGITGSAARRSQRASSAYPATAAIRSTKSNGEDHAKRWPADDSAKSSETVAAQKIVAPITSGWKRPRAASAGCGTRMASAAARTPSGRLIANTARQPTCSVRYAPSTGPEVLANANTVAKYPEKRPRSRGIRSPNTSRLPAAGTILSKAWTPRCSGPAPPSPSATSSSFQ